MLLKLRFWKSILQWLESTHIIFFWAKFERHSRLIISSNFQIVHFIFFFKKTRIMWETTHSLSLSGFNKLQFFGHFYFLHTNTFSHWLSRVLMEKKLGYFVILLECVCACMFCLSWFIDSTMVYIHIHKIDNLTDIRFLWFFDRPKTRNNFVPGKKKNFFRNGLCAEKI